MKITNQLLELMKYTIRFLASVSGHAGFLKNSDDFVTTSSRIIENFMETVIIDDKDKEVFYVSVELYQYFYGAFLEDYGSIMLEKGLLPGINFDEIYITFCTQPKYFGGIAQRTFSLDAAFIDSSNILCYVTVKNNFIKEFAYEMVESPPKDDYLVSLKSSVTIIPFCNQIIKYIKEFHNLENHLYLNVLVSKNNKPLFLKDIRNFTLEEGVDYLEKNFNPHKEV